MSEHKIYEKGIQRALLGEFKQICGCYRLKLPIPSIQLNRGLTRLGYYVHATKELFISFDLIANYSWLIVGEVLRHEIAHMYVSIVLNKPEHTHMDLDFIKMCNRFAIPASARFNLNRYVDSLKNLDSSLEADSIVRKLQKLEALSTSDNPHEAELAMTRMKELLEKHQESIFKLQEEDFVFDVIKTSYKRLPLYYKEMAQLLKAHFWVETLLMFDYNYTLDDYYSAIEIIGKKQNVVYAMYVFKYLEKTLDRLYTYYKKTSHGNAQRNAYYLGLLQGFSDKLSKEKTSSSKSSVQGNDLIVLHNQKLIEFLHRRNPSIRTKSSHNRLRLDEASYVAGQNAGKNLSINRPLETSSQKQKMIG